MKAEWIDLQINGYGGVDFNAPGLDVDRVVSVTEKLEQDGLVRRYSLDDRGSACWQYAGTDGAAGACRHHFHLKCTECGTLFHLNCDHLQEIAAHVASEHGFCIDPARTVFYGICADCAVLNEQKEGTENNETENL